MLEFTTRPKIPLQPSLWSVRSGIFDLTHPPARNIFTLDLLRSLAIILVFSGHFAAEFQASPIIQKLPPVYFGWTGVDLFFVLSGYLIGMQIWKELQKTGEVRLGRFLLRRGFRIWPLYFSFVLLVALQGIFFGRNCSGLWADALCVSNYFHHQVSGGWSLSTEEQFYILFPVAILVLSKVLSAKAMVSLPIVALVLLPVFRALTLAHSSGVSLAQIRDQMYYPIHTHSDGLAVGVLLAWLLVFQPGILIDTRRRSAAGVACLLAGVALYVLNKDIFNFSSLALIFGGTVLFALSFAAARPPWISGFFYLVSRLSYGIYLNHLAVLPLLVKLGSRWLGGNLLIFSICYAISFALCLAVAAITFLLIEHPFLELRTRWAQTTL